MLIVVRHGRTEANATGRLLGRLDVPLDELGRRQATALAAAVGPVDRVVSSPLQRTRETAEAFGHDVEIDPHFIELDYGEYDGLPLGEVPGEIWREWRRDSSFAPPGGESIASLQARVDEGLERLREAARTADIVIVTHVSPVKATVAWALGVEDEVTWRMFVSPASITRVAVAEHGLSLRTFNEIAHLDGIVDEPAVE